MNQNFTRLLIKQKKKCVCFVTGVPGAGKTLVGLDVVAKSLDDKTDRISVYLSGNSRKISSIYNKRF